jgi:Sulfotransferase domain
MEISPAASRMDERTKGVARVLPNLFIVGAAKCGTTSLHYYLDQHPSISMSTVKEPAIFSDQAWRERIARYERMLDARAPVRGESSTSYTKHPAFPDVPGRIAEAVREPKLIYLVRDPLSRCISQWVHNVAAGRESRSLNHALRDFDDPENLYIWCGRYASQIERYLEYFPVSDLLVLDQVKLLDDRLSTLSHVFRFLGVDASFHSPRFESELNKADTRRQLGAVGARLRASRVMSVYRRMPLSWRPTIDRVRRLVLPPIDRPELDDKLRSQLSALYDDELTRLAELTGVRLARTSSA